ncbi:MAG TPA: FAD-dependent oxidoreductase [Elusimicrobiota bacterium]|nr:FAD-dependent oxidoreductase [Elusimicrobiota bacterium]
MTSSSSQSVVVIGAGIAGLSCARALSPTPVRILEREDCPGGLARSYAMNGFTFDYTGHLLHLHDPSATRFIRSLLKGNLNECSRNAWIFSNRVFTRYPFQANLYGLPPRVIAECFQGLREAVKRAGRTSNDDLRYFDRWCLRKFGRGISRHFMFPYNRKLWNVSPSRLTAEWCGPFVPQPRLEDVLAGALTDQTKGFGYNVKFFYPRRGGIQAFSTALARPLDDVRYSSDVRKIMWKEKRLILSSGEEIPYRCLVSTMPLTDLVERLEPSVNSLSQAARRLKWTSVMCLNLGVDRPRVSDRSWVYFPEKEFVFYRVGFPVTFSRFVAPAECSSLYVEVSFSPGRPPDQKKLFSRIRKDLIRSGILRAQDDFPAVSFVPIDCAYVVYDRERSRALDAIFPALHRMGIYSIGRYGAWKYSFMEEAVLDGRRTAEAVLKRYPR